MSPLTDCGASRSRFASESEHYKICVLTKDDKGFPPDTDDFTFESRCRSASVRSECFALQLKYLLVCGKHHGKPRRTVTIRLGCEASEKTEPNMSMSVWHCGSLQEPASKHLELVYPPRSTIATRQDQYPTEIAWITLYYLCLR